MARIFAVSQDWLLQPPPPKTGPGGGKRRTMSEKRNKGYMYYSREKGIYRKL